MVYIIFTEYLERGDEMDEFIRNVRIFLSERKIKNSYVSLVTGWDKSKVSRILRGDADIKMNEAYELANALGQDVKFFLGKEEDMRLVNANNNHMLFYAGHLDETDKEIAENLLDMFKYFDALTDLSI